VEKKEIKYTRSVSLLGDVEYEDLFDVSNIENVLIEFITNEIDRRMIVTTEYGTVLYDTDLVSSASDSPEVFEVDVTLVNNIYITVELGNSGSNTSYSFTAYFKKVHNENTFIQVPVTFEGINQSPSLDIGICDDLHLAWQSNRSKYWNVYYSHSVDKFSHFRHETQITDTESNSIRPSVSVNRTGSRMIAWNDNRQGDFNIYAARSLEGYDCNQKTCEVDMLSDHISQVNQCSISFDYTSSLDGIYDFVLYFYSNAEITNLYKTIILEDNEEKWFVDGDPVSSRIAYDTDGSFLGLTFDTNETVTFSYVVDKDDGVFDIILYIKLNGIFVQEIE